MIHYEIVDSLVGSEMCIRDRLLNIECSLEVLEELSSNFKFNDAVIRNMVIKRKKAITESSSILTDEENDKNEGDSKKVYGSDDKKSFDSEVENV